jgi:hypothetical protein
MSRGKKGKAKRRGFGKGREQRKVAILTPCDDHVATPYAVSLAEMCLHTLMNQNGNLGGIALQAFGSSVLPHSREQLAQWAIDQGSTHTLWIDSDMKFPKDTMLRFLERDEPIIGINAMTRRPTFRCTAQSALRVPLTTTAESTGLEKVYRMGFGVMWIQTEIFKSMKPPRFDFKYLPDQGQWRGEDYHFFEHARELGHDFYVDHDLSKEVYHMGAFGYNPLMVEQMERDQLAKVTQASA